MEYTIAHQTTYYYADSVNESYTVLHLQPRSDPHQFCTKFAIDVTPHARINSYADRFGNDVQHFAILPPHDALSITTRSNVVTMLEHDPMPPFDATRAMLEADPKVERFYDFLHESSFVRFVDEGASFRAEFGDPGESLGVWCTNVMHHIHASFSYDTDATTVRTTVTEAIARRAGVCQDFAHIMISGLRGLGLPARYISGYIRTIPPPGKKRLEGADATHAWVAVWCGARDGWVGLDPTNDIMIGDDHIILAKGRDYADISPVAGIILGSKEQDVDVMVDVIPRE